MSDLLCVKCKEPWDSYHVAHDMDPLDAEKFKKGYGCPACAFGTVCKHCDGIGLDREYARPNHQHNCFGGRILAWSPNRSAHGYKAGRWYSGYLPNVIPLDTEDEAPLFFRRIAMKDGKPWLLDGEVQYERDRLPTKFTADGPVQEAWVLCVPCLMQIRNLPCFFCKGTGKLQPLDDDAYIDALSSHVDGSDEDPIRILDDLEEGR